MQVTQIVHATTHPVLTERRRHPMPPQPEVYSAKVPCGCDEGWTDQLVAGRSLYEDGKLVPVRCPDCGGNGTHDVYAVANGPAWSVEYPEHAGKGGFLAVRVTAKDVTVGWCRTFEEAQRGDIYEGGEADRVADAALLSAMGVRP